MVIMNNCLADNLPSSKNGNFSKGETTNKWEQVWVDDKADDISDKKPPDPNNGGGGNRIPISNGLSFLMIGSVVYIIKRIKDKK